MTPHPKRSSESRHGGQHRLRRRRASHRAAIAAEHKPESVPEHPLIPRDHPDLLADPAELADLLDHVREVGICGYDTEFIGESTYYPRLCLIQIGTAERIAVIDALANLDLTGVWELLADPAVLKIVHAGSQDLEPVVRHLDRPAANIFDTQVAAGFCRLPYPLSLTRLVEATLGIRLGKGLTFTSWDERPLSRAHLRYAADDVRYLPALHAELSRRLDEIGHGELASEEFEAACHPELYAFDPHVVAMRMRGAKSLSPKQLAILLELVAVRDEAAQMANVPPRAFLRDEVLVDMARRHVTEFEKLHKVRGLPRPVVEEFGTRLIEAIERGLSLPKDQRPTIRDLEESATERFTTDAVWATVQSYCLARGIDFALVGTRQDIVEFLKWRSGGPKPSRKRLVNGWRADLVATLIDDLTAGRRDVTLTWRDGALRTE